MQLSHTRPVTAAAFDDRNLLATAGLIPVLGLAQDCGLADLADEHLTLPTDKGAHPGRKVTALVAGMVAGADSIDDMALLRHGAMPTVFDHPYAPSTLGSFLRTFTFGHVRQIDAIATRFLTALAEQTPLVSGPGIGPGGRVLLDIDAPPSTACRAVPPPSCRCTGTASRARATDTPGSAGSTP